ncbi:MAG: electron transporter RnfB, partial [Methylovulum sp.]|nr:electron transporter RnfB [Methylovulum sp.]
DAILGAAKFMHTVIVSECTGCELCVAPCPVDCIVMQSVAAVDSEGKRQQAAVAKRRYEAREQRKAQEAADKAERANLKKAALLKMKSA